MEWRITPAEFWACSSDEQAIMIAGSQAKIMMQSWEDEQQSIKLDRERKKAESGPPPSRSRVRR